MLNSTTLLAMTSISAVFVALLFIIVWRGDTRYAGMDIIKFGTALFAVCSGVFALRNTLPSEAMLLIGLGDIGTMIGSAMGMNGALILAEKRPIWRWHIAAIILVGISTLYYLVIQPSTPIRASLSSCWGVFMTSSTLFVLMRGPQPRGYRKTQHGFIGLLIIECFFEFARGALAPFIDPHIDYRHPNPILTVFYLEVIFFLIGYLVLMLQLVNDRLRADLRQSEARITAAFQVTSDAFALFDRQDRLIIINSCFRTLFPEAIDRLREGTTISELFAPDPELFGLEPAWLDRYHEKASDMRVFDRIAHLSRGTWLRVSGRMPNDGGLVLCWSDVTAFKQAEDVLRGELARERELAILQRNFVSMASHQFRTPLAIIDINAQLLDPRGKIPLAKGEVPERVSRIRRTVARMVGLIEMMLGASSIEAGKMQLKREPIDMAALLREAAERAREFAPDRQFDLEIETLPVRMLCDATLIDQVFSNLLTNAIKYSSAPSPIILAARMEGRAVVVSVADFGVGIAAEDHGMIFERFYRAGNVSDVPGTGIGLTVARAIVELHGGRISVDSQLGGGSTFTVRLPFTDT